VIETMPSTKTRPAAKNQSIRVVALSSRSARSLTIHTIKMIAADSNQSAIDPATEGSRVCGWGLITTKNPKEQAKSTSEQGKNAKPPYFGVLPECSDLWLAWSLKAFRLMPRFAHEMKLKFMAMDMASSKGNSQADKMIFS
jgi:hypothetical protein